MGDQREREYVEYVTARLPTLHRTAYLLCGDRHLADDLVQMTITSLYLYWGRARAADNLDAYVHRILVRKFVDEKRLSWSRVRLMWAPPERPDERTATADGQTERRDEVVAALRALPRGQRAVLVLRYLCDLSVEETAAALGCSAGNVKSQTSRGLTALRPLLDSTAPAASTPGATRAAPPAGTPARTPARRPHDREAGAWA